MKRNKHNIGFTLLEMLLVLVIISAIITAILGYTLQKTDELRRDRAALQMQQILNAGMAYYIDHSKWPTNPNNNNNNLGTCDPQNNSDLTLLQQGNYLPQYKNINLPLGVINNPWGQPYSINCDPKANTFIVKTTIPPGTTSSTGSENTANILAGRLPMATVTGTPATTVVAQVNIPGQDLNNARAVNYADIYHSGGCVPVPTCPGIPSSPTATTQTVMVPQIFVIPVSVSGSNDPTPSPGPGPNPPSPVVNVYPISSFTAFALGPSDPDTNPPPCNSVTGGSGDSASLAQCSNTTGDFKSGFWRVCLNVVTERGAVTPDSSDQPSTFSMGSILAITRCAPQNEPTGADIGIWGPTTGS